MTICLVNDAIDGIRLRGVKISLACAVIACAVIIASRVKKLTILQSCESLFLRTGNEDVVSAAPPAYTAAVDQQPAPTTTLPQTGLPPQPQFIQLQKGAYPQQIAYAGQQPVVVGSQPVPTYVYPQQQVVPGVPPVQQMQYVVS